MQALMNATARVLSSTHKYDRGLLRLPHSELHWLKVLERVQYKLGIVMYSCLHGLSPRYLRRSLCASVRCLSKAESSIRNSESLGGSAMPAQHTRSTGLLCGWPTVALELSTRQLERSESWQGQLQTFAEDASIFTVLIEAFSVLEMFRTIRSTNLLTYLQYNHMVENKETTNKDKCTAFFFVFFRCNCVIILFFL